MVLRVPPYAGECRFVRVTSVLIFAWARACVAFVLARKPWTARDICRQPTRAKDLRRAPGGLRARGLPPETRRS